MSSVINISALINHETNENRFNMKDMKLPVTCHQKKDMNHFIYLIGFIVTAPNNNGKSKTKLRISFEYIGTDITFR